jgi:tartrate-resistant acid phosphatase type 5
MPSQWRAVATLPHSWLAVSTGALIALPASACTSQVNRSRGEDTPSVHVAATPTAVSAGSEASPLAPPSDGGCPSPTCAEAPGQRFVIIGDYGASGPEEAKVAELARSLKPDFIITTGDNNYPLGAAETIDENVGRYFHEFIAPYHGTFGKGATENAFFPSLGNHDWYSPGARPYLDFFSLPNNERYYDVVRGPVQLFALDSDPNEPDGTSFDSAQARWFEQRSKASTVPWRVVYFHHPPYSSGPHGSTLGMRWPFRDWGASVVYSGHDHTYERFDLAGFPYIVNGVGGNDLYQLVQPLPGSVVRHADVHGLVLVTASATELVSRFLDSRGQQLDVLRLHKP